MFSCLPEQRALSKSRGPFCIAGSGLAMGCNSPQLKYIALGQGHVITRSIKNDKYNGLAGLRPKKGLLVSTNVALEIETLPSTWACHRDKSCWHNIP